MRSIYTTDAIGQSIAINRLGTFEIEKVASSTIKLYLGTIRVNINHTSHQFVDLSFNFRQLLNYCIMKTSHLS